MSLTAHERAILTAFRRHRSDPPTFPRLVRESSPRLVPVVVVLGLAAGLFAWVGDDHRPLLLVGVIVGFVANTLMSIRGVIRNWPTIKAVIDWDRVNVLLDSDAAG